MLDCFEVEITGINQHQPFFEQIKRDILVRLDDPVDAQKLTEAVIERTKQMAMSSIVLRYIFKETIEEDPTATMTEYYLLVFKDDAIHCQVNTEGVYQTTHVLDDDELGDFLKGLFDKLYDAF
ncbi:hypothetical protein HMI01_23250 [Halolactibacillus miurensis]|uniref:Uncharacterized protein n=1 Tax=Halolactibacillus miurensis TaxID=306541 RepID=A0A1I6Q0K2_9BACI|nr:MULTISPECIES: hypothetical protein [Halolactibacillus]GEM05337.1 hypothetical protein HMI01_23250 [Halolactibacillus miurensis]SFS45963.1 hypothetical protein SAMN05421668_10318 [Halolactibacillus miurensis]